MGLTDTIKLILRVACWPSRGPLSKPRLISLAPNEVLDDNQHYVTLLEEQVGADYDNASNKNIALSGEYGTGKSSIIRRFLKNHENEAVVISFATLNSQKMAGKNAGEKNGEPAEGKKGEEKGKDGQVAVDSEELTLYADMYDAADRAEANGIQKEIVKQLMFREKSNALTHSKFSRVGPPSIWFRSAVFIAASVMCIVLFSLPVLSLNGSIQVALGSGWEWLGLISTIAMVLFVAVPIGYIAQRAASKFSIDKMGSGNVSVSFTDSKNYFDDYLDEIIYLFEKKKYTIVVFEDLDRFNNLLIFERLRALNTALNHAKNLKGRNIRFIYAVRDSLFDNEAVEDVAASRAKFFDIIIPVVPFLTFENSFKHFRDNLPKEDALRVGDGVLLIAAQHITDMRLIHDICNEYKVFAYRLDIANSTLGLKADNLFAMMVFKNKCPGEFSRLKDPTNLITEVIKKHTEEKKEKINNLQNTIDKLNYELRKAAVYDKKIKSYNESLQRFIKGISQDNTYYTHTLINNKNNEDDEDKSVNISSFGADFWMELQGAEDDDTFLKIRATSQYSSYPHVIEITKAMIQDYIGEVVSLNEFDKAEKDRMRHEVDAKKKLIKALNYSSIRQHLELEDREAASLDGNFSAFLGGDKSILSEFMRAGYIDDYYLQYYSTYRGDLSRDALHYRHEFIERGESDMIRNLADSDIKLLLTSLDVAQLSSPGMINVDIIDYLIRKNDKTALPTVILTLIEDHTVTEKFINEYEKSTKTELNMSKLIKQITSSGYLPIFDSLCQLDAATKKRKLDLLSSGIEGYSSEFDYTFSDETRGFILDNIGGIKPFSKSSESAPSEYISNAVNLLKTIGHRVDLRLLNNKIRAAVVKDGLYRITSDNMRIIVGKGNFSLDRIRFEASEGPIIYNYLLNNLDEYVDLIQSAKSKSHSLSGLANFEDILNDVYTKDSSKLTDILKLSDNSNCIIDDINKLHKEIWSYVINGDYMLVQPYLQNILDYYNAFSPEEDRSVDSSLADYLNEINGVVLLNKKYESYDETERNGLLRAVMESDAIKVRAKTNFVVAFFKDRSQTINIKFFDLQEGELYGELLNEGVLADTIESYQYISEQSWLTKEHYLANSAKARDYISKVTDIDDINNILTSEKIPRLTKSAVVGAYNLTLGELSDGAAVAYGEFVLRDELSVSPAIITSIAGKITSDMLVDMVNGLPSTTDRTAIKQIFVSSVNEQLRKISSSSRKRVSLEKNDRNTLLLERLKSLGIIRTYTQGWWRPDILSADIVE